MLINLAKKLEQFILYFLMISTFNLLGCTPKEPKMMEFILVGDNVRRKLELLDSYVRKNSRGEAQGRYLIITSRYPSMEPFGTEISIPDDHIRITLEIRKKSEADFFIEDYKKLKGSGKDAEFSYIGKEGEFDAYRRQLKGEPIDFKKILIKPDENGRMLMLQDSGAWAKTYRVYRLLDSDIEIMYQFDKSLKNEFLTVDKKVVDLIKSFIKN